MDEQFESEGAKLIQSVDLQEPGANETRDTLAEQYDTAFGAQEAMFTENLPEQEMPAPELDFLRAPTQEDFSTPIAAQAYANEQIDALQTASGDEQNPVFEAAQNTVNLTIDQVSGTFENMETPSPDAILIDTNEDGAPDALALGDQVVSLDSLGDSGLPPTERSPFVDTNEDQVPDAVKVGEEVYNQDNALVVGMDEAGQPNSLTVVGTTFEAPGGDPMDPPVDVPMGGSEEFNNAVSANLDPNTFQSRAEGFAQDPNNSIIASTYSFPEGEEVDNTPDTISVLRGEPIPFDSEQGGPVDQDNVAVPALLVEQSDPDDENSQPRVAVVYGLDELVSTDDVPAQSLPGQEEFMAAATVLQEAYGPSEELGNALESQDPEAISDAVIAEVTLDSEQEIPVLSNPADFIEPTTNAIEATFLDEDGNPVIVLPSQETLPVGGDGSATSTTQYFNLVNNLIRNVNVANAVNVYGYNNIAAIVNSLRFPDANLIVQDTFVRLTPLSTALSMIFAGATGSVTASLLGLMTDGATGYAGALGTAMETFVGLRDTVSPPDETNPDPENPDNEVQDPLAPVYQAILDGMMPVQETLDGLGVAGQIDENSALILENMGLGFSLLSEQILLATGTLSTGAGLLNPELYRPQVEQIIGTPSATIGGSTVYLTAVAEQIDALQPDFGVLPPLDLSTAMGSVVAATGTFNENIQNFLFVSLGLASPETYLAPAYTAVEQAGTLTVNSAAEFYELTVDSLAAGGEGGGGGEADPAATLMAMAQGAQDFAGQIAQSGGSASEIFLATTLFVDQTQGAVGVATEGVRVFLEEAPAALASFGPGYVTLINESLSAEQGALEAAVGGFGVEAGNLVEVTLNYGSENLQAIERLFGFEDSLVVQGAPNPGSEDKYQEILPGNEMLETEAISVNTQPVDSEGLNPPAQEDVQAYVDFLTPSLMGLVPDTGSLGPIAPENLNETVDLFYVPTKDAALMGFPQSAALFDALEPLPTDYSDPEQLAAYVAGLADQDPAEFNPLDLNEDGMTDQADAEFFASEVQAALQMEDDGQPFDPESVNRMDPTTYPTNPQDLATYVQFELEQANNPDQEIPGAEAFESLLAGEGNANFDPENVDFADPETYPGNQEQLAAYVGFLANPENELPGQTEVAELITEIEGAIQPEDDGSTFDPATVDFADPTTYPANQEDFAAYAAFLADPENFGAGAPSQAEVEALVAMVQDGLGMGEGTPGSFDPEAFDPTNIETYPQDQEAAQSFVEFYTNPENLDGFMPDMELLPTQEEAMAMFFEAVAPFDIRPDMLDGIDPPEMSLEGEPLVDLSAQAARAMGGQADLGLLDIYSGLYDTDTTQGGLISQGLGAVFQDGDLIQPPKEASQLLREYTVEVDDENGNATELTSEAYLEDRDRVDDGSALLSDGKLLSEGTYVNDDLVGFFEFQSIGSLSDIYQPVAESGI